MWIPFHVHVSICLSGDPKFHGNVELNAHNSISLEFCETDFYGEINSIAVQCLFDHAWQSGNILVHPYTCPRSWFNSWSLKYCGSPVVDNVEYQNLRRFDFSEQTFFRRKLLVGLQRSGGREYQYEIRNRTITDMLPSLRIFDMKVNWLSIVS